MRLEAPVTGLIVCLLGIAAARQASAAARTSQALHEGWTFRQVGRAESYPAAVPGVVHLDLVRNELIGDPFYRDYEKGLQWIGKTDWEYRAAFDASPEVLGRRHVELVFDGLDTYARVTLNGREILAADNMYRQWRVPVPRTLLRAKDNEIAVVFRSPINEDLAKVRARGYELPAANDVGEKTSVYARKAPYSFGWDWGPRFVTCGIFRPVRLEAWDDARILDVAVRQTELGKDKARLLAEVEVVAARAARPAGPGSVEVVVEGAGAPVVAKLALKEGVQTVSVPLEIDSPRLWWPNGYGEQPLYTVTTRLLVGGASVDEKRTRIGLRTLELRRQQDEFGKSFEFVVNGVPVFAKGANWIPADSFLPRVTRERYALLLRSAADAHMNMLRVWGGGIYENDEFYELADELGLLVWQDFHFSCSLYPADAKFLASVEAEAEDTIRRLRNHPSLALWNGNNEIEAGWFGWGWKDALPAWLWNDYKSIFHDLLPRTVARLDPTRSYWPSSPSANLEALPGDCCNGDTHYWGVWHGQEPFESFEKQRTRFMSEYGFQSFPEMKTIRSFARWDDLALESPVMLCAPEELARQSADPRVHAARLRAAEGLRLLPLREPGAPGGGDQGRGRGAAAGPAAHDGLALLAARRLLAGRLLVEHRLLRPLEGAPLLCPPLLCRRARQHLGGRRSAGREPRLGSDGGAERGARRSPARPLGCRLVGGDASRSRSRRSPAGRRPASSARRCWPVAIPRRCSCRSSYWSPESRRPPTCASSSRPSSWRSRSPGSRPRSRSRTASSGSASPPTRSPVTCAWRTTPPTVSSETTTSTSCRAHPSRWCTSRRVSFRSRRSRRGYRSFHS